METGFLLKFDQVPLSLKLMMSCLDDLKSKHETWTKALECFMAISTSRNGLREFEIANLLNLSSIDWAILKNEIKDFILLTDEGFYVMYHPYFRDLIKTNYLAASIVHRSIKGNLAKPVITKTSEEFWHTKLSDYFNSMDSRRIVDAAYHLLQAGANSAKICTVIGRIMFLESAVSSNLHQEVPGILTSALAVSRFEDDTEGTKTIKESISFWQTYSKFLLQCPKLAVSLALNMPAGFATRIKHQAETLIKGSCHAYFRDLNSQAETTINFVGFRGHHVRKIILVTIQVTTLHNAVLQFQTTELRLVGTLQALYRYQLS